jgi:hypothetical protein
MREREVALEVKFVAIMGVDELDGFNEAGDESGSQGVVPDAGFRHSVSNFTREFGKVDATFASCVLSSEAPPLISSVKPLGGRRSLRPRLISDVH